MGLKTSDFYTNSSYGMRLKLPFLSFDWSSTFFFNCGVLTTLYPRASLNGCASTATYKKMSDSYSLAPRARAS